MTRVGITGQVGFVGYHLWCALRRRSDIFETVEFEDAWYMDESRLAGFAERTDVIVHLAGMNRGDPDEIYRTNLALTEKLIVALQKTGRTPHIIFASSTQRTLDNPYGRSKRKAEELLNAWSKESGANVTTLVIPNVFGPFGRPFYNSVVATFCHQLTHAEIPQIHVDSEMPLVYVGDLVERICGFAANPPAAAPTLQIPPTGVSTVSGVLKKLRGFQESYLGKAIVPDLREPFDLALFNTFRSYIDEHFFPFRFDKKADDRGYLAETIKSWSGGQAFFSVTKPGVVRGNHYHTRKFERFAVVSGSALIRMRRIGTTRVVEYRVSGEEPSCVDLPVLYTHNIENTGPNELLTLFWTNEFFDPQDPDTFAEKV